MGNKMLQITNEVGRKFIIKIIKQSDLYGLNDCLVHNDSDPMIEFYDATYKNQNGFGKCGQFVTRYFYSTLKDVELHSGIQLEGGIADWNVSAKNVRQVLNFAKFNLEQ